jgi:hypothetical protein
MSYPNLHHVAYLMDQFMLLENQALHQRLEALREVCRTVESQLYFTEMQLSELQEMFDRERRENNLIRSSLAYTTSRYERMRDRFFEVSQRTPNLDPSSSSSDSSFLNDADDDESVFDV